LISRGMEIATGGMSILMVGEKTRRLSRTQFQRGVKGNKVVRKEVRIISRGNRLYRKRGGNREQAERKGRPDVMTDRKGGPDKGTGSERQIVSWVTGNPPWSYGEKRASGN